MANGADSDPPGQAPAPAQPLQLPQPSYGDLPTTPPPPLTITAAPPKAPPPAAAKPPPLLGAHDTTPPPPLGTPDKDSTTPPPKRVGRPPTTLLDLGADALPKIAWGVDGAESGHSQYNKDGSLKTSPKGAVGRMQLMPGSFPGVDVKDENANLAAGRGELKRLYDTYHNWPDTLIGYNWGEANLKKWIAEGRPADALPQETKKYLLTVAGETDVTPGLMFSLRKDTVSPEDSQELLREQDVLLGRTPKDDEGGSLVSEQPSPGDLQIDFPGLIGQDAVNRISAFNVGGMRGLEGIGTGPVQAVLEQTDPQRAQEFTNWVNQRYEPYAALTSKYPWTTKAGEAVGYTAGMITAGILTAGVGEVVGAGAKVAQLMSKVPAMIKAGVGGAVAGGLSFNEDPASANRAVEAIVGSVFGEFGLGVSKLVGWGLKTAGNTAVWRNFQEHMKDIVGGVTEDSLAMKKAFADWYETLTQRKNLNYTVRNRAGEAVEGYPSGLAEGGGVSKVLDDLIKDRKIEDADGRMAAATDAARSTAARIESTMRLDAQRKEQKEAQDAIDRWEKDKAAADSSVSVSLGAHGTGSLADLERLDPAAATATRNRLEQTGAVRPLGPRPAEFQARPISPTDYADARVEVRAAARRAKDPRTRQQLNKLGQQLDETMHQAALDAGIPVQKFEKLMKKADKFNKDEFAPAQRLAGGRTASEYRAADNITDASVYNRWVRLVKGNDRAAQKKMYDALGPEGRKRAAIAVQHDMFMDATGGRGGEAHWDPGKLSKYVDQHWRGLEATLGRDEVEKLKGVAKIAERLGKEHQADPRGFSFHHPFLLLGLLTHGSMEHILSVGGRVLGLTVVENIARNIRLNPRLDVVLKRAGKTTYDSKEMDQIVKSVEMVFRSGASRAAQTGARTLGAPMAGGGQGQGVPDSIGYRYLGPAPGRPGPQP